MVVVRLRSESEMKDTLKKLKKMHKFTKELIECFEDKLEDDDEDYRYDDEDDEDEYEYEVKKHHRSGSGGMTGRTRRYRRSM